MAAARRHSWLYRSVLAVSFVLALFLPAASHAELAASHAELTLAPLLKDNMVFQRNAPVHVWGWAGPNASGVVHFHEHVASFHADALGRWSVSLQPEPAGGPFQLAVQSGTQTVQVRNILIGEVWVASGQSNMEFTMADALRNGPEEIRNASDPDLRLLVVEHAVANHPTDTMQTQGWKACTPSSVKTFSAVAYFFAREIRRTQHVPVGVIDTSWGGTPAEAWTSLDALTADAGLMPVFAARASMMDRLGDVERLRSQEAQANELRVKSGVRPLDVPWRPNPDAWEPAALFNGMISPLTPFPVAGVVWYQGESNTGHERAPIYQKLFTTLIKDWRSKWQLPELPFLYVQLANFQSDDDWAAVRDAQRRTLDLRNTGMAVTTDIGEAGKIHPPDKQDVGLRLALWARSVVYGETGLECSGPLVSTAWIEGGEVVITFTHAKGLKSTGTALTGFSVADATGNFTETKAMAVGETVRVQVGSGSQPRAVRYNWSSDPHGNLVNSAGLPASPFHLSLDR